MDNATPNPAETRAIPLQKFLDQFSLSLDDFALLIIREELPPMVEIAGKAFVETRSLNSWSLLRKIHQGRGR